jgi:hypothetical protein
MHTLRELSNIISEAETILVESEQECKWCQEVYPLSRLSKFCSKKCRDAYNDHFEDKSDDPIKKEVKEGFPYTDDRPSPITCKACETVNFVNRKTCRNCGESLIPNKNIIFNFE